MIGQNFLKRSLMNQTRYGAMVQSSTRGFAGGGPKKPAMDPKETEFDVVIVGKFCSFTSTN